MSGHSHWASIKHKKGKADAAKGKIFSRLGKQVTIAARTGGDVNMNAALRTAVDAAREANMPRENIERAIKRGTGELPGVTLEQCTYEAYGPGGVGFIVDVITDNKNRTVAEIKHIFSKYGGSIASPGSVSRLFTKKGIIGVSPSGSETGSEKKNLSEEELMELAINVGAADFKVEGDQYTLITEVENLSEVKEKLKDENVNIDFAQVTMFPETSIKVDEKTAEKILKIMDTLEEQQDVQNVYANFDIPDEIIEKLEG
jgi:YebC/PmpR family DNA-binding regulatory protein